MKRLAIARRDRARRVSAARRRRAGRRRRPHGDAQARSGEARRRRRSSTRRCARSGSAAPRPSETARARLAGALKIDSSIWEAWHDLGVIAWQRRRRRRGDRRLHARRSRSTATTRRRCSRAPRRTAAPATRRKRAPTTRPRCKRDGGGRSEPPRCRRAPRLAAARRRRLRRRGRGPARHACASSGTNAKIYTELGQIYIAQKRLELAQLVLAKALELDAKDPAIYNALALLALKQGKAQEAFERFDQAASLDANYIDARFNKASVLLDAGDYARAKAELAAIVEKQPDDYAAQVALGVAHRGLKELRRGEEGVGARDQRGAEAQHAARRRDVEPRDPQARLHGGRRAGGKADLERYLQEAPSSHAKRQDAENKCKEVKCTVEAARPRVGAAGHARGVAVCAASHLRCALSRRRRTPRDRRRPTKPASDAPRRQEASGKEQGARTSTSTPSTSTAGCARRSSSTSSSARTKSSSARASRSARSSRTWCGRWRKSSCERATVALRTALIWHDEVMDDVVVRQADADHARLRRASRRSSCPTSGCRRTSRSCGRATAATC